MGRPGHERLSFSDFCRPGCSCHTARARYRPGGSIGLHGHDFAEVFWIEGGRGAHDVVTEGSTQRSDLRRGTVVLIGPLDAHAIRSSRSNELVIANVAFPADRFAALLDQYGPRSGYRALGALRPPGLRVSEGCLRSLATRFGELARTDLRRLALDRFLLELLHDVETDLDAGDRAARLPRWLATTIDAARADPELLAEGTRSFAAHAGRSVDHLNRTCRRYLGTTASGLVNRLRLDHAEHLLRTTSLDVTDVAYRCGFGNLSYFYRRFRERTGASPRRFRDLSHAPVRVG